MQALEKMLSVPICSFQEIKVKKSLLLVTLSLLLLAATTHTSAQSSDRDNPIPLNSAEITGDLNEPNRESFYSLTAGPGTLTITVDVSANPGSGAVLNFEVLARNGSSSLECCHFAQSYGGATGRDIATVKLAKRQTVILHTTNDAGGSGTFRIRLTGATLFTSTPSGADSSNDNTRDRVAGGGERIHVPASGILHITLKNGTTQDVDLRLVSNITVRP